MSEDLDKEPYGSQEESEIADVDAYRKWIKLRNHPILSNKDGKGEYKASDGNTYSLSLLQHNLIERIWKLPEEEQDKILDLKSQWTKLNAAANAHKLKAFGIKKGDRQKGSLLTPYKEEVIELFGSLHTIDEVHNHLIKKHGKKINKAVIGEFRKINIDLINQKQEEFKLTWSDIRLGHKRGRLEELVYLYNNHKSLYQKKIDEELDATRTYDSLIKTIEQIRKETEGDRLTISGGLQVNIQASIEQHAHKELQKTINVREIVMARLSSRLGVRSHILMEAMNNSYYRALNGYLNDTEEVEYEDVSYPSSQEYDFDKIKEVNKQKNKEDEDKTQKEIELRKISKEDKEHIDFRERLKLFLARSRKDTDMKSADVKDNT